MKIEPCKINLEPYENREELGKQIIEICGEVIGILNEPDKQTLVHAASYGVSFYYPLSGWDLPYIELTPHEFIEKYGPGRIAEILTETYSIPEKYPYGEALYGGIEPAYRIATVKDSDLKNFQTAQEDDRPLSKREEAWLKKQQPEPEPEDDRECPGYIDHADFPYGVGWRK